MSHLEKVMEFNREFVDGEEYLSYNTTKYPDKKIVILTCMDTRLVEMLPQAMNVAHGDAAIVKNAGAVVSHPFGSIMRSILVAIHSLGAEEVYVVGHHDCGMASLNAEELLEKANAEKSTVDTLENAGIELKTWLTGFDSVEDSVRNSVSMIKNHPLLEERIPVHGLVIDPGTGKLELVVNGEKTEA
ncbi:carbonic anhydrase [Geomicrobium sp. JCM 19037]|nr:carbonic anhydrase [Geomicrobium sp. JCM 19037]GAK04597.1 carbonic anhydrase [Geomicrobium sp. JCM 19037]